MWCLNYSKSNYFSFLLISLVVSCNSKEPDKVYDHCFSPERAVDTIAYNPPSVYESENKEGLAWHNIPSSNNPVEEERFTHALKLKWESEQSTSSIKLEKRQIPNDYKIPEELTKSNVYIPPTPLVPLPRFSGEYNPPRVADRVVLPSINGSNTNSNHVEVDGYSKTNGTYVVPHMRTAPNSTTSDNFSTSPNINPYTGEIGTHKY